MAACGVDWPKLDAVWISHFHMDHVGGIGPLLAGTKHAPEMQERAKPLTTYGPAGLEKLFNGISAVRDYKLRQQPFLLSIVEVEPGTSFQIVPGVTAATFKTPHTAESLAIHLVDDRSTIVYSADTGCSDDLAAFAAGVDLMILECSFVRDKPNAKHLVLNEAVDLINKARPKRAMLTHFYPEWDEVDFEAEISALSPVCEVVQAQDGLEIVIHCP